MLLNKSCFFIFLVWEFGVQGKNETNNDSYPDLATVVLFLAREHVIKVTSTVVIAEQSLTPETEIANMFLMNYLLVEMQETVAVQLYFSETIDQPWEYYIFIVDSIESFRILQRKFTVNLNNRHFYFLIVLTNFLIQELYDIMSEIFELCLQMKVIDAYIVLVHPNLGVCMFRSELFAENNCRIATPMLHYIFQQNWKKFNSLYPEKLNNFNRCPLKITARILEPMVQFTGNVSNPKPVGKWNNLDGIEGYLLKYFSSILNFTIEVLPFPQDRTYGLSNGTAYGCFADLLSDRADIAIGGFSASDASRGLFSTSKLIHSSPFGYVVNPQEKLGPLARLAKPFSHQALGLLAFLLIFGMVFVITMKLVSSSVRIFIYGEENTTPWLNFIGVFLGYPVKQTPLRTFARYLLMMWILLWLVIRNCYQAALYDAIRTDSYIQIPKGLEDLLKQNYEFLITPDIDRLNIFPKNRTIVYEGINYMERYKILERSQKNYATLAVQDNFMTYMAKAYFEGSHLYLLSEVLFMYQVVFYFPKNSIFIKVLNRKISELTVSGLIKHLNTYYTAQPALFSKIYESPPKKPFTNERLIALYEIYLFLTIVAIFVFGLELMSMRYKRIKRILEWVN